MPGLRGPPSCNGERGATGPLRQWTWLPVLWYTGAKENEYAGSPHLARYGLRPEELASAHDEREGQNLAPGAWAGPISEEEQAEHQQWLESLMVRSEDPC